MERPNILLILMDDLGWKDLGCYGSTFYETPRLDQLAEDGLRFTDAYASCPVCSPTRASILTGRYPARVGVTQFIGGRAYGRLCDVPYFHFLPPTEYSVAAALRDGGYQTWHVGKWHLGNEATWPEKHGFDVNRGGCDWGMPKHGFFAPYQLPHPDFEEGPDGEYLTDRLTDEAVRLIKNRDPEKPFFLNLWHYAVHVPIDAPEALIEKYRKKAADLGLDQIEAIEEGEAFPMEHKKDQRVQRRKLQSDPAYAAMVENMDTNIGRVLDALEAEGLADNTLVVFTSDNGGLATAEGSPTCNAPLAEGKGWMYEGGTREPFIVRWPDVVRAGGVTDSLTTSTDLYPTFLEAAGLDPLPDQHCDGKSLMPLLRGEAFDRGAIYWHYPHYANQGGTPGCSVREGDWKLIEFFEDNALELYNLRNDTSEDKDVAEAHPERVADLKGKLDAWKTDVQAIIPRPNPGWQPGAAGS